MRSSAQVSVEGLVRCSTGTIARRRITVPLQYRMQRSFRSLACFPTKSRAHSCHNSLNLFIMRRFERQFSPSELGCTSMTGFSEHRLSWFSTTTAADASTSLEEFLPSSPDDNIIDIKVYETEITLVAVDLFNITFRVAILFRFTPAMFEVQARRRKCSQPSSGTISFLLPVCLRNSLLLDINNASPLLPTSVILDVYIRLCVSHTHFRLLRTPMYARFIISYHMIGQSVSGVSGQWRLNPDKPINGVSGVPTMPFVRRAKSHFVVRLDQDIGRKHATMNRVHAFCHSSPSFRASC